MRHFIRHGPCLDGSRHVGGAVVVKQLFQVVDDGSMIVAVAVHSIDDAATTVADDTGLPWNILDALKQVEDDAGETGVGQVDLLVIWHLPNFAKNKIFLAI